MTRALVAVALLAACERTDTAKPVVRSKPIPDAAVVTADASPALSAPRPPTLPASLAAAPAWIMRRLDVGMVPYPQLAETFTLRRDANHNASLEIAFQLASVVNHLTVDGWKPVSKTTIFVGTATEAAGAITLELAHDAELLHLVCKPAKAPAASATAIRDPSPQRPGQEGCGDEGRWIPAATKPSDVLRCTLPEDFAHAHDIKALAFAPDPGIEWLYVNDDCAMQGGGYRAIAADHSIAPFRSSK